ncbi:MAG: CotH kinase family protein [Bacteroidales bacterium]|nr:CotH kinase family protein [Bacteroidales bacterium]
MTKTSYLDTIMLLKGFTSNFYKKFLFFLIGTLAGSFTGFSVLYGGDHPEIAPPVFSRPGGIYQQAFELELHTPHDGTYTYTVSKEGYEAVSGEITVTGSEISVPVVLYEQGRSVNTASGAFTVSFYVDMTDAPYTSGDQVFISGNMVDPQWPEPGSNPAMQMQLHSQDPLTYRISFNLDAGEYAYKYFLNPGWADGEWSGPPNRTVHIYSNTSIYDTWAVIDPDDPDDPDPEGFSTVTFMVEDQHGQEIPDAVVTFNGETHDPGTYVFEYIIPAAVIRYTTDGSIPDGNSTLYTGPISITDRTGDPNNISLIPTNNIGEGHVYNEHWQPPAGEIKKLNSIRAAAFIAPDIHGKTETHSYLVDDAGTGRYSMPLISINAHAGAFFDADTGIYVHGNHVNYHQRGPEWERLVHFEFFETHGSLAFAQDMGARIHGGTSRNRPRKSLRMYARSDYGTTWVDYHLFPDKNIDRYKRFLLRNSGNDWGDAIFRDAFMQSLLENLDLDIQYSRPAIVFINGEYWGIHNIRDRLDNRYLETHYGIDDEMTYTILERNAEFERGNPDGRQHYLDMINFLNHHGVSGAENYAEIKTRMDVENFTDYQIAQIYFMNTDWPGNNIQYWRYYTDTYNPDAPHGLDGRWRWQVFDVDFGFGLNFNYVTGVEEGPAHNTLAFALETNGPSWPNPPWSTLILRKLLENDEYRLYFINRFSDLLNTNFHAGDVVQKLDDYHAMYLPEMPEHIHRWRMPHDMDYWESEVYVMRNFALQRPGYLRQYLAGEFNLGSAATLTVHSANPAQGGVRVNTVEINQGEPWSGQYFTGLPLEVAAAPKPGYYFSHWEGAGIDDPSNPVQSFIFNEDRSFVAHYQDALVHYWHFNNLPDGEITTVNADYSASGAAMISYPGTGDGYMDRTDGTLLNAREGAGAGYGLRVRNPSDTRKLLIEAPSEGFKDLSFSFAARRTNNGAQQQTFHYSTDGGEHWTQLGNPYGITLTYELKSFDLSDIPETNNNPDLQFKMLFTGTEASDVEGNNRFDNIVLSGVATELNINKDNPPAGFLNDTYPGHYFSASGGQPPYSFSVTSGNLPPGLHLNANGLLYGVPQASGNFSFFVTVTDQAGAEASHMFTITISEQSLIHYWHFNNLGEETLTEVKADHSLTGEPGRITYPGTGPGYMDRTDGTTLNAHLDAPAGYGLRVRNPSNTRELIFSTPSTGYQHLEFSFAVQRTSNGAQLQALYFSADGGGSWTLIDPGYGIDLPFERMSFDLSGHPEVNNNPYLLFRILFLGEEAAGSSGNNRFDNVALQGQRFDLNADEASHREMLHHNYPNPFTDSTSISFDLQTGGHVSVDVYNLQGQHVKSLLNAEMPPGTHEVVFQATSLPEGLYIYRINAGGRVESGRMIKIR